MYKKASRFLQTLARQGNKLTHQKRPATPARKTALAARLDAVHKAWLKSSTEAYEAESKTNDSASQSRL
jgi:hypothetical protein